MSDTVEAVKAAKLANQCVARPDMKMIGVGKLYLAADLLQILRRKRAFDRGLRADVHENRRLHPTVRRVKNAAAGMSGLLDDLEHLRKLRQAFS